VPQPTAAWWTRAVRSRSGQKASHRCCRRAPLRPLLVTQPRPEFCGLDPPVAGAHGRQVDQQRAGEVRAHSTVGQLPSARAREHGAEVAQLPFQLVLGRARGVQHLVPSAPGPVQPTHRGVVLGFPLDPLHGDTSLFQPVRDRGGCPSGQHPMGGRRPTLPSTRAPIRPAPDRHGLPPAVQSFQDSGSGKVSGGSAMRVAVVDRSPEVREAIAQVLRGRARVVEAASLAELVRLEEPAEVVVADFAACAGPCRGELEALRSRWPGVHLVVATPRGRGGVRQGGRRPRRGRLGAQTPAGPTASTAPGAPREEPGYGSMSPFRMA
jgi:CheY-like chemotaxis protein